MKKVNEITNNINNKLELVDCPNICLNGYVKYYDNPEIALFHMGTCPYCKGKVSIQKAKRIEAIL